LKVLPCSTCVSCGQNTAAGHCSKLSALRPDWHAGDQLFTAHEEFQLEPVIAEVYEGTDTASYKVKHVRDQGGKLQ